MLGAGGEIVVVPTIVEVPELTVCVVTRVPGPIVAADKFAFEKKGRQLKAIRLTQTGLLFFFAIFSKEIHHQLVSDYKKKAQAIGLGF